MRFAICCRGTHRENGGGVVEGLVEADRGAGSSRVSSVRELRSIGTRDRHVDNLAGDFPTCGTSSQSLQPPFHVLQSQEEGISAPRQSAAAKILRAPVRTHSSFVSGYRELPVVLHTR